MPELLLGMLLGILLGHVGILISYLLPAILNRGLGFE
jgi:hypothetical protein